MNNFIFKKPYYTNTVFTKDLLKILYSDFCDLGYRKTYQEFFADLSYYCEPYLGETDSLFSKAAKPYISERLLQILESLTQAELSSKIFALCAPEMRKRTAAEIPCMQIQSQGLLEVIQECCPESQALLTTLPETLFGFATPIYTDEPYLSKEDYPKTDVINDIRFGMKTVKVMEHPGEYIDVEMPAKISITVKDDNYLYEFPIYWDGEDSNLIHTVSVRDGNTMVIIRDVDFLTVSEYADLSKEAYAIAAEHPKKSNTDFRR